MSENKKQTLDKQQNGNDFIADVIGRAYFGDTYVGDVIKKEYNHTFKKNILTIKTPSGFARISEPNIKKNTGKWNVKPYL